VDKTGRKRGAYYGNISTMSDLPQKAERKKQKMQMRRESGQSKKGQKSKVMDRLSVT